MHVTYKRACVGRNLGGTAEYLRPFWDGDFFMLLAVRSVKKNVWSMLAYGKHFF